ncbi:MAG: sigma 54-interacting transcriptional regulator [Bacteroidota bacterium]|nr:sigma 54-interacting transcriptional regulator [Bacteroidota bacterium]
MWFSTTAALVKYNGKEYEIFDKAKGLLEDFALNVRQDNKGYIWVGCPGGVSRIKNNKIDNFRLGRFDDFYNVFVDSYDRVWAYNFQFISDIYFLENDSLFNFSRMYNFRNQRIFYVNEDKKGSVHLLTSDGKMYKYFTTTVTEVPISSYIQEVGARMFFFDSEGDLVLCGQKGAAKILLNRITNKYDISWIIRESVVFGLESANGYYWIATQENGLFRIKARNTEKSSDKNILHITSKNGLPTDNLFTLFEDREENIWIGTNLKGISKLSSMRFITYGKEEEFAAEAVLSITSDRKSIYCLTENGIFEFNQDRFLKIQVKDLSNKSRDAKTYLCMLQIAEDSWILGSAPGLYLMNRSKNIELIGLPRLLVQTFFRDFEGNVWIGTNKGIYKLENNNTPTFQDFGIQNRYVNKLLEVRKKDLYVATDSGLVIIENATSPFGEKSVRNVTTSEGLLSNMINDLEVSYEGDIIIATSQGINILTSNETYSVVEGLHHRFVIVLFIDRNGQLWAGTDNGLHLLKKVDGKYKVVAVYLQKDGLMSNEFTRNGTVHEDKEGRIWFGTYGGLTLYNPMEKPSATLKPYCYLTALQANDSTWHNVIGENYEFGYTQNKLSFFFEGLSYFDEDAVRFEYYLEPLEKAWSNTTLLPTISYGYLDPGAYTFHVRAISVLGYISDPQKLSFTITAPFWKRTWFFIALSLFVLVGSYGATQYRLAHIKKRNLLLENIIREKTEQLQLSKDTLEKQYNQLLQAQAELVEKEKLEKAYEEINKLKNRLAVENVYLKEKQSIVHEVSSIVGKSEIVQQIRKKIIDIAPIDSTVLITGETGVGKNLIAEAIHTLSTRKEHALITVNCAAIPEGLVESELFGHEKGAFTGANERRIGKFEIADGSTIFLDEVGDMNLSVQAKILNVLEERKCTRVGGNIPIDVNVRVIAASNYEIEDLVKDNKFRKDLYYRLNVFRIDVPPLKDRLEDVEQLAKYFIDRFSKSMNKKIDAVTKEALSILKNYNFPGNIRELENIIQRAVILCEGEVITDEHIVIHSMSSRKEKGNQFTSSNTYQTMEQVEREYILNILEKTQWKIRGKTGAAEILGLHPNTLRSRMIKLQIPFKGENI